MTINFFITCSSGWDICAFILKWIPLVIQYPQLYKKILMRRMPFLLSIRTDFWDCVQYLCCFLSSRMLQQHPLGPALPPWFAWAPQLVTGCCLGLFSLSASNKDVQENFSFSWGDCFFLVLFFCYSIMRWSEIPLVVFDCERALGSFYSLPFILWHRA